MLLLMLLPGARRSCHLQSTAEAGVGTAWGHLIVYHWPAVRSIGLVVAIGILWAVTRPRGRRRR